MAARRYDDIAGANRALQDSLQRGERRIVSAYGLVGAILMFGMIGYAIDAWMGSAPWGLVAGLGSGVAVGFFDVLRSLRPRARAK